ncbi:MAG: hypothetical protein QOH83_2243 [Solirubrobacteraceae bacterium]|jgi:hypothetical protein|nr:hypothetical protein [Solirubrobacteraceae bacterium]
MAVVAVDVEIAIDLAHDVLTQVAPEELALFAVTSSAYRADPGGVAPSARDEMLGFGAEAITALTPVMLSVAGAVASYVLAQVRAVAQEESESAIRGMVRKLFRLSAKGDDAGAPAPPVLTGDQLRLVRDIALERARALKLPHEEAQLLAEALVGRLAIA